VDAFRQLDKDAKGEVDMQTLKQSLTQEIQINDFTPEKLALFFGRFDKLKRSKIKYS
jgi:Ca2+-binding EF-hand superfamily protein